MVLCNVALFFGVYGFREAYGFAEERRFKFLRLFRETINNDVLEGLKYLRVACPYEYLSLCVGDAVLGLFRPYGYHYLFFNTEGLKSFKEIVRKYVNVGEVRDYAREDKLLVVNLDSYLEYWTPLKLMLLNYVSHELFTEVNRRTGYINREFGVEVGKADFKVEIKRSRGNIILELEDLRRKTLREKYTYTFKSTVETYLRILQINPKPVTRESVEGWLAKQF